jgi:hypothetical protein
MNRQAIVKAEEKLVRMRRAVCAMKEASEPDQIKRSWEDFIVAATTFYNALAHGAKGNNKSNAWFGKKKHAHKTDPLLKDIHHARNAENHGIEQITDLASSQITLKGKGTTVTLIDAARGSGPSPTSVATLSSQTTGFALCPFMTAMFGTIHQRDTSGKNLRTSNRSASLNRL